MMDLNTTEGVVAYVRTLTDEQLRTMAAISDPFKIVFAAAAECELIVREVTA